MTLFAVLLCRDEIDVIEYTLRHLAEQGVECIIAIDRMSSDGTREALDELDVGCEIVVEDWKDEAFYQGERMTEGCNLALDLGATWVIPSDCDEAWSHESGRPLADVLATASGDAVRVALYTFFATPHDDPAELDPFRRMTWRQPDPSPLPKVILRWRRGMTVWEGNHGAANAGKVSTLKGAQIRHVPYRSENQTIRKIISGGKALSLTNLPEHTGAHWRSMYAAFEAGGEDALRQWYRDAFFFDDPLAAGLVYDPITLPA